MNREKLNEQETFWQGEFGDGYVERNSAFRTDIEDIAWKKMLTKAQGVRSILECGSNVGRNLKTFRRILPAVELGLIEVNKKAYKIATEAVKPSRSFNGTILASSFEDASFDLTFTSGVLIHIHPDELKANLEKIFRYSRRYVLFSEYYSHDSVEIPYHGNRNKLFKRDFGKYFLENFPVHPVDYGFLWDVEFHDGGFDDTNWWLFEKK